MTTAQRLRDVTSELAGMYPIISGGLLANCISDDDPRWTWACRALEHVERITAGSDERMHACLDAFAFTSMDFLRLQARFLKTGAYALSGSGSLVDDLYGVADEMQPYLDGLALTYAMWPNHASLFGYFAETFVPALPADAHVLEVGPGHGMFAAALLTLRPDVTYVGVDISPTSVEYSRSALVAAGVDQDRYTLHIGEASRALDRTAPSSAGFDGVVCCEVLEHVEDPGALLDSLRGQMRPGAPAFLTTVANLEAIDHVYLFHDREHIVSTISEAGFTVLEDLTLPLPGSEQAIPLPLNFAAIASA